jgi:hypothetical protein
VNGAGVNAAFGRIVEQHVTVAHEFREERQACSADGARRIADRSFDDLEGRQALRVVLPDLHPHAFGKAFADSSGKGAVDDCRLKRNYGKGADDRLGEGGRGPPQPRFQLRA